MKKIIKQFGILLCLLFPAISLTAQTPHWTADISGFSDNMSVTNAVYLNGTKLTSDQIEVAAFYNGVCRGTAFVGNGGISGICFLSVFGNTGDSFTFRIYDHQTNLEYPTMNALTYVSDETIGDPGNPYQIIVGSVSTDIDAEAVGTAKALIEAESYMLTQANANTENTVKAWLANRINALAVINAIGITINVSNIAFTEFHPAQKGTSENMAGTNGSFTFAILLAKGASSDIAIGTGTITATPFGSYAILFTEMEHGHITTTSTHFEANETVWLTISPDSGYELATITATGVSVSGSGTAFQFIMPTQSVTVSATFRKTQEQLDFEAVTMTSVVIENENFTIPQAAGNTEDAVKAWLVEQINAISYISKSDFKIGLNDIAIAEFQAAQAGTANNPAGTNGQFTFVVFLNKGAGISFVTASGTITATDYATVTAIADVGSRRALTLQAVSTNGGLYITGLVPDEMFRIYNLQGKAVHKGIATGANQTVNLNGHGIYIVVAGKKQVKVVY
jgi:hypothetical protein